MIKNQILSDSREIWRTKVQQTEQGSSAVSVSNDVREQTIGCSAAVKPLQATFRWNQIKHLWVTRGDGSCSVGKGWGEMTFMLNEKLTQPPDAQQEKNPSRAQWPHTQDEITSVTNRTAKIWKQSVYWPRMKFSDAPMPPFLDYNNVVNACGVCTSSILSPLIASSPPTQPLLPGLFPF